MFFRRMSFRRNSFRRNVLLLTVSINFRIINTVVQVLAIKTYPVAVSSRCRLGLLSSTTSGRVGELGRNEPRTDELLSQVEYRRRNIYRASRVVAVSFYQLIPLGGMRTYRLVPEGELGYGWHNNTYFFIF